jgi:ribosomal-protein-alanine N-acetyltransferase
VSAETEPQAADHPQAQRLGPEQLEACLALDQASLAGLWTRAQWQQELSQGDRICMGLVLEQRLVAVACGWLVLDELQIGAVAVAPEHRRQGHGQRVLIALLREARRQGAANATLEVSAANTAATALYGRCGFSTAGIRRGYYRNGDDALIQWLRLQDMEGVRIAAHS